MNSLFDRKYTEIVLQIYLMWGSKSVFYPK